MRPWMENLIKGTARGAVTWATVAYTWNRLRREFGALTGHARDEAEKVADSLRSNFVPFARPKRIQRPKSLAETPRWAMDKFEASREAIMEKKKGWSFFKVVLILGILVAVAVFLLDRILPKPYRDEELDEAWEPDGSWDEGDDGISPPLDVDDLENPEASDNGTADEKKKGSKSKKDEEV